MIPIAAQFHRRTLLYVRTTERSIMVLAIANLQSHRHANVCLPLPLQVYVGFSVQDSSDNGL